MCLFALPRPVRRPVPAAGDSFVTESFRSFVTGRRSRKEYVSRTGTEWRTGQGRLKTEKLAESALAEKSNLIKQATIRI